MVRRGEGAFEVKVANDNILLVLVCALHTEAEVGDRPRAGAVCPESFLSRAEDLACLDVIRSRGYDTGGPKLIKSIGKRDRAFVVQPIRICLVCRGE